MEKLITASFELFNAVPVTGDEAQLSKQLLEFGFIVPENIDPVAVKVLERFAVNTGRTFYQKWSDISKRSGYEILVDHIIYYIDVWLKQNHSDRFFVIPGNQEGQDGPSFDPKTPHERDGINDSFSFHVVRGMTLAEIKQKARDMVYRSVAYKEDTINHILNILTFGREHGTQDIDPNQILNRDCRTFFQVSLGIQPSDPVEILRCLIFDLTGSFTLIKSRECQNALALSHVDPTRWLQGNEEKLSHIFHRFKPLFMAMKMSPTNRTIVTPFINKIGHLGTSLRKTPGKKKSETAKHQDVSGRQDPAKMNGFQLVRHLKHLMNQQKPRMHLIRNGKVWCERDRASKIADVSDHLTERLDHIHTIVSPLVRVALPTSEKNFAGPFPLGTEIKPSPGKCLVVGIFWRNIGTHRIDLDLSCEDFSEKIGWDGSFKTHDVMFSGDVVEAPDGANEMLFFKNVVKPQIININWFNSSEARHICEATSTEGRRSEATVDVDIIIGEIDPDCVNRDTIKTMIANSQDFATITFRTKVARKTHTVGVIYPERGLVLIDKNIGAHCQSSRWNLDKEIVIDAFTKHNLFFDSFCQQGPHRGPHTGTVRRRLFSLAPPRITVNLTPEHVTKDTIVSIFD